MIRLKGVTKSYPAKVEELGLTPKSGFSAVTKVVLEGVIARKGRQS